MGPPGSAMAVKTTGRAGLVDLVQELPAELFFVRYRELERARLAGPERLAVDDVFHVAAEHFLGRVEWIDHQLDPVDGTVALIFDDPADPEQATDQIEPTIRARLG